MPQVTRWQCLVGCIVRMLDYVQMAEPYRWSCYNYSLNTRPEREAHCVGRQEGRRVGYCTRQASSQPCKNFDADTLAERL